MPAVYIATMMDSGHIKCRPKFTSGLDDNGPEDKRLIIEFQGSLSRVPWVFKSFNGYTIDFDLLANAMPELFSKKWLRNQGHRQASIVGNGNKFIIDVLL